MSDYVYQPYPGWRFHPTLGARLVADEAEDQALGAGWVDSHLKLGQAPWPEPAPEPVPEPVPEPAPDPPPLPDLVAATPPEPVPVAKRRAHRRSK